VYLVFGASGGIGSALSKRLLAQPGATVLLAGRDEAKLQQLVDSLGGGEPGPWGLWWCDVVCICGVV
jgi:NADP-dependent 3-hydroxy acid dehydrogenase YdfG